MGKIIRLNEINEKHYDSVVPFLEKRIRDNISPIVGRK